MAGKSGLLGCGQQPEGRQERRGTCDGRAGRGWVRRGPCAHEHFQVAGREGGGPGNGGHWCNNVCLGILFDKVPFSSLPQILSTKHCSRDQSFNF